MKMETGATPILQFGCRDYVNLDCVAMASGRFNVRMALFKTLVSWAGERCSGVNAALHQGLFRWHFVCFK